MSSLEERLKQIRQSASSNTNKKNDKQAANNNNDNDDRQQPPGQDISNDEIQALLKRTADEVEAEKGLHHDEAAVEEAGGDEQDLEDWLQNDSDSEGQNGGGSDRGGKDGDEPISASTLKSIRSETEALERDAQSALTDLRASEALLQDTSAASTTSSLRLEPKVRPTISRNASHKSSSKDDEAVSLENELAEAMSGDLGTEQPSIQESLDKPTSFRNREVDDLTHRLAELRANARMGSTATTSFVRSEEHGKEEVDGGTEASSAFLSFDLPSAPKTVLPARQEKGKGEGEKDNDSHDWKVKHDVQGRDLSPFETLVRLNASALGAPSSTKPSLLDKINKKKASTAADSADKGETDDWCCICNEDATLLCLGCDRDLYCKQCWDEGHLSMDREELADHRTKLFSGHKKRPMAAA